MGSLCTQAQVLTRGKSYGTHPLTTPVLIDSVNLSKTSFDLTSFIKRPYEIEGRRSTSITASPKGIFAVSRGTNPSTASLSVYSFNAVSPIYTQGNRRLYGRGRYAIYADGTLLSSNEKTPVSSDTVPAITAPLTLEATH